MDIEKYTAYCNKTEDEDVKFVPMEMIIQAIEEQSTHEDFQKFWNIAKFMIKADTEIHNESLQNELRPAQIP